MSLPVRLRVAAEQDVASYAAFIQQQSADAALAFLDAVDATFALLGSFPEIGGRCRFAKPAHAALRVFRVTGFRNHLVFYRLATDELEVVRVLHGARDLQLVFGQEES